MRYLAATVIGVLMLYGFLIIGAGGDGWIAGAFGCLFLAPLSFVACLNALARRPSRNVALNLLFLGISACIFVWMGTLYEGTSYFFRLSTAFGGGGTTLLTVAYLNWVFTCMLALYRVHAKGHLTHQSSLDAP